MPTLVCPQCSTLIEDQSRCAACELDVSLIVDVRRSAERLAATAVRHAANGEWQAAYDAAAESLQLARSDNDFAAFVLLVAALAGARGTVRNLPALRAENLPPQAAVFLDDALATARQLRNVSPETVADAEAILRELHPRHPFLLPPPPPRSPWPLLAAVAATVVIMTGFFMSMPVTRLRPAAAASVLPVAVRATGAPVSLPPPAAPPPSAPAMARAAISLPSEMRVYAYRQGRDASKRAHYDQARRFLELAIEAPRSSWYWDDALFLLGKSYHRLGRRDEAAGAYHRLERDSPQSLYIPEVRRLLGRLSRGQGVER